MIPYTLRFQDGCLQPIKATAAFHARIEAAAHCNVRRMSGDLLSPTFRILAVVRCVDGLYVSEEAQ